MINLYKIINEHFMMERRKNKFTVKSKYSKIAVHNGSKFMQFSSLYFRNK